MTRREGGPSRPPRDGRPSSGSARESSLRHDDRGSAVERGFRFFVDGSLRAGDEVTLAREPSYHLVTVLRARPGDAVILFNGDGLDYAAALLETGRTARLEVRAVAPNPNESPLAVTLAQGISRGDRMDATVRQAVELGVARIVPLATRRGRRHDRARIDPARAAKRHAHWRGIVLSACAQCGRSRVPTVEPERALEEWLERFADGAGTGLVLAPGAGEALVDTVPEASAITLLIGPESGLDADELDAARAAGLRAVRLGPRVLRTETAGPAALAVLQARHGDLRA